MPAARTYRIGTSGYDYPDWRGTFYPDALPSAKKFAYYARRFDTVEINATFYHFPRAATIAAWRERAPANFRYALKAWKVLTHVRRLRHIRREWRDFWNRIRDLGESLAVVLFQLPPGLHRDRRRLQALLRLLPEEGRFAIEFRHRSWLDEAVYGDLRKAGVAVVRVSSPKIEGPAGVFTAPFGYWRLHGAREWYRGNYTAEELQRIAREIRSGPSEAFVYFDNTARAAAVDDARALMRILRRSGRGAGPHPP